MTRGDRLWSETTLEAHPSPALVGSLLAGKYRVERILGRGGMGVVVAAKHELLGHAVAIKLLLPERVSHEAIGRLLREARAVAKLTSEHVVRVHDADTTDDGVPFIVMEYLEGHDLAHELETRGAAPIQVAVSWILDVLGAIGEAHDRGIVHRDLKPANVFLAREPDGTVRLRVLDFGISKVQPVAGAATESGLTNGPSYLGSPRYMSPEQIRSPKEVDARTDLWSIGVLLFELLTGERAFSGEGVGEIFAMIREDDLPPVRTKRPEVPVELEAIVARCLQRDRAKRFASARALAEALAPFAAINGVGRRSAAPSRRYVLAAVAASALAGGALLGYLVLHERGEDAGATGDRGQAPSAAPSESAPAAPEPAASPSSSDVAPSAGASAPTATAGASAAAASSFPRGSPRPRVESGPGAITRSKLLKTRE